MTYDLGTQAVTLLDRFSMNTWNYDGVGWIQAASSGPPPRQWPAIAYDSSRNRVVVFGGLGGGGFDFLSDTWEWDGTQWHQIDVPGPPRRHAAVLAYDSDRQRCVLFGGVGLDAASNVIHLNDTWEWDGTQWTQLSFTSDIPHTRDPGAMVYDSARRQMILFGGFTTINNMFVYYGDTWALSTRSPADFNGDGILNSQDFFDYLTAFFTTPTCPQPCPNPELACPADFNHDCLVNSTDFFDFLAAFFAGC